MVTNLQFPVSNSTQYYDRPQNTLLSRYARKHHFVLCSILNVQALECTA